MKDNGGWSAGPTTHIECPKCGAPATQLETTIYGRKKVHINCSGCAKSWTEQERDNDEGDSAR